jgi:hypothetical protein
MTGRKHNATGRSTGEFATSRFRISNRPPKGEPFVWTTLARLKSPAHRALSLGARKIIDRVAIEHMNHGGGQNGSLVVTYNDFEAYGIRRRSLLQFLEEAIALGFIGRTHRGRRGWGEFESAPARTG